jgi:hypothetical protein
MARVNLSAAKHADGEVVNPVAALSRLTLGEQIGYLAPKQGRNLTQSLRSEQFRRNSAAFPG